MNRGTSGSFVSVFACRDGILRGFNSFSAATESSTTYSQTRGAVGRYCLHSPESNATDIYENIHNLKKLDPSKQGCTGLSDIATAQCPDGVGHNAPQSRCKKNVAKAKTNKLGRRLRLLQQNGSQVTGRQKQRAKAAFASQKSEARMAKLNAALGALAQGEASATNS